MEMFGKKKPKKKKVKAFNLDELNETLPEVKESGVPAGEDREQTSTQPADVEDLDLDFDFSRTVKKKRSKKKNRLDDLIAKTDTVLEGEDNEQGKSSARRISLIVSYTGLVLVSE